MNESSQEVCGGTFRVFIHVNVKFEKVLGELVLEA